MFGYEFITSLQPLKQPLKHSVERIFGIGSIFIFESAQESELTGYVGVVWDDHDAFFWVSCVNGAHIARKGLHAQSEVFPHGLSLFENTKERSVFREPLHISKLKSKRTS